MPPFFDSKLLSQSSFVGLQLQLIFFQQKINNKNNSMFILYLKKLHHNIIQLFCAAEHVLPAWFLNIWKRTVMSLISFNSVSFYYTDSEDQVFEDLSLNIDTSWRLGLTGKNGRGKTTFLKLIGKEIQPVKGEVVPGISTFYFPYVPEVPHSATIEVVKESIAPYTFLESRMKELLAAGDEKSISEYGNLLEQYESADGYEIDSLIEKEFAGLKMNADLLQRRFDTLSGGEQTKALIIVLFLKKGSLPLIDEPTDHLDMKGRMILGDYLSAKSGFIIASHDRHFLDLCTDQIMSINKSDVRINKGNYSQWKSNMDIEEEFELRKNENLRREVTSLDNAAKNRRKWADEKEKEKIGAYDKGFVGRKSAKQMKRALHIEKRINEKLEQKKSLLKNAEDERQLKISVTKKSTDKLLSLSNVSFKTQDRIIIDNISLDVHKGDRIAIIGDNGCGKTSLLKIIMKELTPDSGIVHKPNHVTISYSRQNPLWEKGLLRDLLRKENIDETRFRNIMGVMGAWGELFERPLETFSKGQVKKIELCRSFLHPVDLFIWDEPLNNLDIFSREQLEAVILKYEPTMIFTEHDQVFVSNIATSVVSLT